GASVPPTQASDDLVLWWEAWNGTRWITLGVTSPTEDTSGSFRDGTLAFTAGFSDETRTVSIPLPSGDDANVGTLQPTEITGLTNYWIRVRIVAGNYGLEGRYVRDDTQPAKVRFEPSTFAPPLLQSARLSY